MPQFFQVNLHGELHSQKVANVLWYVRMLDDAPTAADVQELVGDVYTTVWSTWVPVLTASYRLKQIVGYGYAPSWQRSPYLPYIVDYDVPGTATGASAAPLVAAIASCRVEPIIGGPKYVSPGNYIVKPVRRGYWAICGLPATNFQADGKLLPAFNTYASTIAMKNALKASIPIGAGGQPAIPVRVSALAKDNPVRGYGLIMDVQFKPEMSTRRSRKVGIGQ